MLMLKKVVKPQLFARFTCHNTIRSFQTKAIILKNETIEDEMEKQPLSVVLKEEIKQEDESMNEKYNGAIPAVTESMQDFLKKSGFTLESSVGSHLLKLVKRHGPETVSIQFSSLLDEDIDYEDSEEWQGQVDSEMEKDTEEDHAESYGGSMIDALVEVTKTGTNSKMQFELVADSEGNFDLENISFFKTGKEDSEVDFVTPEFEILSPEIRNGFADYLEERGITEDLAKFMFDAADVKLDNEYVTWLKNVDQFVNGDKK